MPGRAWGSSAPASTQRQSPRRAAWSRRYSTTGRLQSRSLPPALLQQSSIEFGVLVDGVEAHLDPDRGEFEDSTSLNNLVRPTIARPGVQVDTPSILLDDGILLDR